MTVSNLVFFIISSILILTTIFIPICVVFHDYCLAVKKDKVCKWYDYMGDGVLLTFLGAIISLLSIQSKKTPTSKRSVGDEFGTDNFRFCLDYIVILFTI